MTIRSKTIAPSAEVAMAPTMPPPRVKPSPNLGNRNAAMKAPAMPSRTFISRPKLAPEL